MWIGRAFVALTFALLCAVSFALGIQFAIDQQGATVWGVYTEERCESQLRNRCHSIGTWVSDDGTITRRGVTLDGFPGADGTVRAGYRPDAEIGGDVVHTSFWIDAGAILSFGLAIWSGGMFVNELRKWWVLRGRR